MDTRLTDSVENAKALKTLASPTLTLWLWRIPLGARVVPELLAYSGDAGFIEAVSRAPDDLFHRAALVDAEDLMALGWAASTGLSAPSGPASADAVILSDRGAVVEIETQGSAGYLILSDCYTGGWSATVDGNPAPIFRADYAFRGLKVPAGEHHVAFRYAAW